MEHTSERLCPACGQPLECKLRTAYLGQGAPAGSLFSLLEDSLAVDVYVCPACGKAELYAAAPAAGGAQPEDEQVTCPVCGFVHSTLINCPRCALDGAGRPPQGEAPPETKQKKDDTSFRLFRPKRDKDLPWEK